MASRLNKLEVILTGGNMTNSAGLALSSAGDSLLFNPCIRSKHTLDYDLSGHTVYDDLVDEVEAELCQIPHLERSRTNIVVSWKSK